MCYSSVEGVEPALAGLANKFPQLCALISLPYATVGNRVVHALRIGTSSNPLRHGVLVMGCAHGNEHGSPEICINFATGLLDRGIDVFVLRQVNPDGHFAGTRTNQNQPRVDLNRNYDFVWGSGIGASTKPEYYPASKPLSECETQNVQWLVFNHQQIRWLMDVHSNTLMP